MHTSSKFVLGVMSYQSWLAFRLRRYTSLTRDIAKKGIVVQQPCWVGLVRKCVEVVASKPHERTFINRQTWQCVSTSDTSRYIICVPKCGCACLNCLVLINVTSFKHAYNMCVCVCVCRGRHRPNTEFHLYRQMWACVKCVYFACTAVCYRTLHSKIYTIFFFNNEFIQILIFLNF